MNKSSRTFLALLGATVFLSSLLNLRAATLPAGFTETRIGSAVGTSPTAMAFAPDGRLFVCLQGGQLRVIKDGTVLAAPFVTLSVDSAGERGLLGVAFDPNFATNQFVYVYYTTNIAPVHNRVTRFTASGDVARAGSETPILEINNLSTATNHNGGAIHFGPDGKLYVATGENANGSNAQTLTNLLGKILRINPDGTIPTDNPFYNSTTGVNRAIWAYGLRNPYTFAFQRGTNRMFINDVGLSTFEEINDGIAGSNYGWPNTEGPTTNPAYRSPFFAYGHGTSDSTGCAITGGAFYNPATSQFPAPYVGNYFYADICSGWIRLLSPADRSSVLFASGISSPVDLQVGPDGRLYYLARGGGGQVFAIQATPAQAINFSTRGRVGTGDGVMIGGFVIKGTAAKKVIVRALGPSLGGFGVDGGLPDPTLELHRSDGAILASNDNWRSTQQQQIIDSKFAPSSDLEPAIVATLPPGSYTAIVRGKNGATGVALVEAYDLDLAADAKLANISTRGDVQTGFNVLIGGAVLGGNQGATPIVVRAIGPSLARFGLSNVLADPVLQLFNGNGDLVATNDNWQDDPAQAAQIRASGFAPSNDLESAVAISFPMGGYSIIVRGKNDGTGIGLVESYTLP